MDHFAERVLELVELIPPGQAMSYGDVADHLGEGGPRQVGRVMALYGGEPAPWWRVVRADGSLPADLRVRAGLEYRAESTPLRPDGRVDMGRARWDGRG